MIKPATYWDETLEPTWDSGGSFADWYKDNLKIGGHPVLEKSNEVVMAAIAADVVINVSCYVDQQFVRNLASNGNGTAHFWFPLGEIRCMSVASIFGALACLYEAERRNEKVYLHCAGGIFRSQVVADCYVYMRTNMHRLPSSRKDGNMLEHACEEGGLTGIRGMQRWLRKIGDYFQKSWPRIGGVLDMAQMETPKFASVYD